MIGSLCGQTGAPPLPCDLSYRSCVMPPSLLASLLILVSGGIGMCLATRRIWRHFLPLGYAQLAVFASGIPLNTDPPALAAMAVTQVAVERKKGGQKRRRVVHTIAESTAVAAAAAESAAMPAGWGPSRFFEAWKKVAAKTAGSEVYWYTMGHYVTLTPDARGQVVDTVLRTTIMRAYKSDDFYEGVLASHNDYEAMQAYAAAFVDAFWGDFWA